MANYSSALLSGVQGDARAMMLKQLAASMKNSNNGSHAGGLGHVAQMLIQGMMAGDMGRDKAAAAKEVGLGLAMPQGMIPAVAGQDAAPEIKATDFSGTFNDADAALAEDMDVTDMEALMPAPAEAAVAPQAARPDPTQSPLAHASRRLSELLTKGPNPYASDFLLKIGGMQADQRYNASLAATALANKRLDAETANKWKMDAAALKQANTLEAARINAGKGSSSYRDWKRASEAGETDLNHSQFTGAMKAAQYTGNPLLKHSQYPGGNYERSASPVATPLASALRAPPVAAPAPQVAAPAPQVAAPAPQVAAPAPQVAPLERPSNAPYTRQPLPPGIAPGSKAAAAHERVENGKERNYNRAQATKWQAYKASLDDADRDADREIKQRNTDLNETKAHAPSATQEKTYNANVEAIKGGRVGIEALRQAMELSPKAYEGAFAAERAYAVKNLVPDFMMNDGGSDEAINTGRLNNILNSKAITTLRATFGGNPTEGERAALLALEGSADLPQKERMAIWERAIEVTEARIKRGQEEAGHFEDTHHKRHWATAKGFGVRRTDRQKRIQELEDKLKK